MTTEDEIAAQLAETNSAPRAQIARVVTRRGESFANTLLQETLALERSGGMMTKDGVYFELVSQRVDPDEWFFITHGYKRGERKRDDTPMDWADRLDAARQARTKSGKVSSVLLMVVGTPIRITPKEDYVLVTIEQGDIPHLPKGLPKPPSAATTFLVGVAQSQWRIVERFVRGGEPLIASGYPLPDEKKGRVVMYASRVDTPSTKKLRKSKGMGWR